MSQTTTLSCKFKDSEGRSHFINIDSPQEQISKDIINDFMQFTIDNEILSIDDNNPDLKLVSIDCATVTTKNV